MKKRLMIFTTLKTIFVSMGAILMTYPLIWMVVSSFRPELDIFRETSLIIRHFTLENYIRALQGVAGTTFFEYMTNTLKLVLPVVAGTLISSSFVGYAIARLDFPFKSFAFTIILLTMMLPMHVMLIPRFIMFRELGWLGTYLPLIVPSFFAVQGFFNYLFIQFIRGIPKELDQAATIDGCNPISVFFRIIAPLSVPAYITAGIFSFLWTYDDFFSQMIYITRPSEFTIALALRQYMDAFELTAFGVMFATSVMSLIPILVLFITCQKYLVEGIATTGLKG